MATTPFPTMPPALTFAAFQAYQAGWSQFAKANLADWKGVINCAWIDENSMKYQLINDFESYKRAHEDFI